MNTTNQTNTPPGTTVRAFHRSHQPAPSEAQLQAQLNQTAQMLKRLHTAREASRDPAQVLGACIDLQNERDNILGCVTLKRDHEQKLQFSSAKIKDTKIELSATEKWLLPRVEDALKSGLPIIASATESGLECIIVPTSLKDHIAFITFVKAPVTTSQRTLELALAQLIASFLTGCVDHHKTVAMKSQMATTAATLELVMRCQDSPTVQAACNQVVADLAEHWKCDKVFIGLNNGRQTCRIMAASDTAVIDHHAESSMLMKGVLDECIVRDSCGSWPPLPGVVPHRLLAHKQFALRDSIVISAPLKAADDQIVGAIAMVGRREMASIPNLHHFVTAVGQPLGSTLKNIDINQGSRIRRAVRAALADKHRTKRFVAMAVIIATVGIMCMPWTYRVSCQSIIEPVERRYCVAPHDGLLEMTLAEPGDVVQGGQDLAKMDGREILWELAGVKADKARVAKKRDAHMAKQETPEALMADLEHKRLANQEALLQFRESSLQMVSPIEGIVLSGSLDRRENYPVSKGQVLYEIAPLDELRIELAVPADDISHIAIGDEVEIYFDGFGTTPKRATIQKIRPRAEIRDEENVFVAEVCMDNASRSLKPGMKGVAKIKTQKRSVAWIVFHRAIEKTRSALPW